MNHDQHRKYVEAHHKHIDRLCRWILWGGILCLILAWCFALTGCAYTTQNVRTESATTNGLLEIRTTKARAVAWGDARQVLDKLKVSNGKTQSIGLEGAENATTTTNIAANLRALTELLKAMQMP